MSYAKKFVYDRFWKARMESGNAAVTESPKIFYLPPPKSVKYAKFLWFH